MNLMGKIFTLLIFFMSICFLVIALMVGASHRNWKQMATLKNDEARLATNRLQDAKSNTLEKEKQLSSERTGRALQLGQLESQLRAAKENLISKEAQLRKESEISQQRLAELETLQARINAQDTEVADLRTANNKLVKDVANQLSSVNNLTNQVFELKNKIEQLTVQESDLVAKLAKTSRVLKKNGLREDDLTDHIVPKLDGLVVEVGDGGLFVISLGSDDGLRVGHEVDVYRTDRFVGKGKIIKTKTDLSAVRIDPNFKLDLVREGDYVTSKF